MIRRIRSAAVPIALAVILVPALAGCSMMDALLEGALASIEQGAAGADVPPPTEESIRDLPPPVRAYLRWAGALDRPRPALARLELRGSFRMRAGDPFSPMGARAWYDCSAPGFAYDSTIGSSIVDEIRVLEGLRGGVGSIRVEKWPAILVKDGRGGALDLDQMDRYLGEMVWFPCCFAGPSVTWEGIDDLTARATLAVGEKAVSLTVHFGPDGRILAMEGKKSMGADGTFNGAERIQGAWTLRFEEYGERGGYMVPTKGSCSIAGGGASFEYIRIEGLDLVEYS